MNQNYPYVLLLLIAFACDSSSLVPDDGKVAVRYSISAEEGAMVLVSILGENEEWDGGYVGGGWEYEFRVEEGAQLLYISTQDISKGSIEAQIYINEELYTSHVMDAPNSTAEIFKASSAWGVNEDIQLQYFIQAQFLEGAQIRLSDGIETFNSPDEDFGSLQRIYQSLFVEPGFEASIRLSRSSIETGWWCVRANISYAPIEDGELFLLARVEQCDPAPIEIDMSIPVPGY